MKYSRTIERVPIPSDISAEALAQIKKFQQSEITEAEIYRRLAKQTKDDKNRRALEKISAEENLHGNRWQHYTGIEMKPKMNKVYFFSIMSRILGFTFAAKYMERGEENAQKLYEKLGREVPEALDIRKDEVEHEAIILDMLDEERLNYIGSMVLGMNDALVEITGTLAGLTFAMQNTRLIALSGLITGIAATLSMASSEYLSSKSEERTDAFRSSLYTGGAYLVTVTLLILPYLLFDDDHYLWALGTMIAIVLVILVVFNFYISVAKGLPFRKRFGQMATISLGVAALSFVIGILVKQFLGVDI